MEVYVHIRSKFAFSFLVDFYVQVIFHTITQPKLPQLLLVCRYFPGILRPTLANLCNDTIQAFFQRLPRDDRMKL